MIQSGLPILQLLNLLPQNLLALAASTFEVPDYFWPVVTAAAAFGTCIGYMIRAIHQKNKAIHGFNGEKQAIKEKLAYMNKVLCDMGERVSSHDADIEDLRTKRFRKLT